MIQRLSARALRALLLLCALVAPAAAQPSVGPVYRNTDLGANPITVPGATAAQALGAAIGGVITPQQFGANCNGSSSDNPALVAMIAAQTAAPTKPILINCPMQVSHAGALVFPGPVSFGPGGWLNENFGTLKGYGVLGTGGPANGPMAATVAGGTTGTPLMQPLQQWTTIVSGGWGFTKKDNLNVGGVVMVATSVDNATGAVRALSIKSTGSVTTPPVGPQPATGGTGDVPNRGAWAPLTSYAVNDVVTNGGKAYRALIAGTSAGSGGPTGTGTSIAEGGGPLKWTYQPPFLVNIGWGLASIPLSGTVTSSNASAPAVGVSSGLIHGVQPTTPAAVGTLTSSGLITAVQIPDGGGGTGVSAIGSVVFANAGSGAGATAIPRVGLVQLPSIGSQGSGATIFGSGVLLNGTDGTGKNFQVSATVCQLAGVSGGSLCSIDAITGSGSYTGLPPTLTAGAVSVTPGPNGEGTGLTGATLDLSQAFGYVAIVVTSGGSAPYPSTVTWAISGGTWITAPTYGPITVGKGTISGVIGGLGGHWWTGAPTVEITQQVVSPATGNANASVGNSATIYPLMGVQSAPLIYSNGANLLATSGAGAGTPNGAWTGIVDGGTTSDGTAATAATISCTLVGGSCSAGSYSFTAGSYLVMPPYLGATASGGGSLLISTVVADLDFGIVGYQIARGGQMYDSSAAMLLIGGQFSPPMAQALGEAVTFNGAVYAAPNQQIVRGYQAVAGATPGPWEARWNTWGDGQIVDNQTATVAIVGGFVTVTTTKSFFGSIDVGKTFAYALDGAPVLVSTITSATANTVTLAANSGPTGTAVSLNFAWGHDDTIGVTTGLALGTEYHFSGGAAGTAMDYGWMTAGPIPLTGSAQIVRGDGSSQSTLISYAPLATNYTGILVENTGANAGGARGSILRDFTVKALQPDTLTFGSLYQYPPMFACVTGLEFRATNVQFIAGWVGHFSAPGASCGKSIYSNSNFEALWQNFWLIADTGDYQIDNGKVTATGLSSNLKLLFNGHQTVGYHVQRGSLLVKNGRLLNGLMMWMDPAGLGSGFTVHNNGVNTGEIICNGCAFDTGTIPIQLDGGEFKCTGCAIAHWGSQGRSTLVQNGGTLTLTGGEIYTGGSNPSNGSIYITSSAASPTQTSLAGVRFGDEVQDNSQLYDFSDLTLSGSAATLSVIGGSIDRLAATARLKPFFDLSGSNHSVVIAGVATNVPEGGGTVFASNATTASSVFIGANGIPGQVSALPLATGASFGVVKGDGVTVNLTGGVISIPTATNSTLGLVRGDGTTISNAGGVLSAVGGGGGVTTFNTRSGAVTLAGADISGLGAVTFGSSGNTIIFTPATAGSAATIAGGDSTAGSGLTLSTPGANSLQLAANGATAAAFSNPASATKWLTFSGAASGTPSIGASAGGVTIAPAGPLVLGASGQSVRTAGALADTTKDRHTTCPFTIGGTVQNVLVHGTTTFATCAITMMASPVDGQLVNIRVDQPVTTLTITPNASQTVVGAPTTLAAAGGLVSCIWNNSDTEWLCHRRRRPANDNRRRRPRRRAA